MKLPVTAAVLAALLLAASLGPAAAQDEAASDDAPGTDAPPPPAPAGPPVPRDPANPNAGPPPAASPEPGADHQDEGPEVSQADARANAATLIQSFLAKHSEGGAFPLRDKTTKKLRRLKLMKVDEKGVEPAGVARFTAPAWLKDEESGETLEASFLLDFASPDWKVVGLRLKPPPAATSSPAGSARRGR
jgi:hypothetical protein